METALQVTTPADLIAQAIDKGLDVDALSKLMDLQERYDANQARKKFFDAFTNFQSEAPDLRKTKNVTFNAKGGTTNYNYAPLASITRQLNKVLKDNELSYRWEIIDDFKEIKVTCLVSHVSGHTEKTTMTAAPDTTGSKNDIQARGSAIEYLKRYTLIGALGLSTADSDVDGALPEIDIDLLHKQYMLLYGQLIQIDSQYTKWDPSNWKTEATAKVYLKGIGEIRKKLAEITPKKP
jgi:hypothetical protein